MVVVLLLPAATTTWILSVTVYALQVNGEKLIISKGSGSRARRGVLLSGEAQQHVRLGLPSAGRWRLQLRARVSC